MRKIYFDHLAKTGGQTINALLSSCFFNKQVGNIIGFHRDIIRRYAGTYSIISAHTTYESWDLGLSDDFKYFTILRDPIDRALSWIFYIQNNFYETDDPHILKIRKNCLDFIESEGEILSDDFIGFISNYYVNHFAVLSDFDYKKCDVKNALNGISKYTAVGFNYDYESFVRNLFDYLDAPFCKNIPIANKTKNKPAHKHISKNLINRLNDLNSLDLDFYEKLKDIYVEKSTTNLFKKTNTYNTESRNALILYCGDFQTKCGHLTHDGISSNEVKGTLLYGPYISLRAGSYKISLIGEIHGDLSGLHVDCASDSGLVIHASCIINSWIWGEHLAVLSISLNEDITDFEVRFFCNESSHVLCRYLKIERIIEMSSVKFTVLNPSEYLWTKKGKNPIQVACHWLDETWNMVQFDAQRFPLPAEGIPPQETRELEIQVAPPKKPGRYHLMVTLVQTLDGKEKWLHETDEFTPQIFDREVEE